VAPFDCSSVGDGSEDDVTTTITSITDVINADDDLGGVTTTPSNGGSVGGATSSAEKRRTWSAIIPFIVLFTLIGGAVASMWLVRKHKAAVLEHAEFANPVQYLQNGAYEPTDPPGEISI
jgi:hypothetical protein